ncbi:phospholipase/lecithinase/hemolysin [Legionella gratiana]|uniref:Phospholipase/lecithinase/hemolysin n=1 Tax=Legionella gratiana TaxID=45066 RepID=A0A378J782_9GAMM|nr:SGNH/GDSL hydrolase family protein [Legionella gratiana]KTD06096.1 phospholipase/lecithinase/hemolysin [Legionella gratiana]STX42831.1 phospholipase/lecithinase/hemolysin [Legionella gratiana]
MIVNKEINVAMTKISRIVVLGDSLSDRGTFDKRKLFGFIPLRDFYEVGSDAPRGRFTNGFVWGDYFVTAVIGDFAIDYVRKKLNISHNAWGNADVSDAILANDLNILKRNEKAFSLNNDKHILYKGERFARFYCEAGLTSYDYTTQFTINPKYEFLRLILASLEDKQEQLTDEDKKYKITKQEKAETLIIEWSGANDLLTVNPEPTLDEATHAVNARIANLETLIQQGYRNFVLLNLPDLSLTPRFQTKSKEEQENAAKCSEHFNEQLATNVKQVIEKYKDLNVSLTLSVFDVNTPFKEMYHNCEEYGFDRNKLKLPYIDSEEFKQNQKNPIYQKEHISPADGYMFWDDIHPTMDTHSWLAVMFKDAYNKIFKFVPPECERRRCSKEAEDIVHHCRSGAYAHLPADVAKIINTIYLESKSLEQSWCSQRREEGELLKRFVFELKCQSGNLHEIDALIKKFTKDSENMKMIKRHNYPIYDFFAGKKTTHLEDSIKALAKAVDEHLYVSEQLTMN